MTEIDKTKELFTCSRCKSKYYQKDFGVDRLEERYKTCIKCRNKRKLTRSDMDKKRRERAIKDEEFKCDDCGGCFGRKEVLTKHIKSVHYKIKDNDCPYDDCEFSSSHKAHLTIHIKSVHTKIKDNYCPYDDCDYRCSRKVYLTNHKKEVHLKIKDNYCPDCDFSCSRKTHLQRHQNLHCHKGDDSKHGSAGEKFIKYILKKLNTPYLFDKPFDNMRSITDKRDIRFDFVLYSDTDVPYFIEFDGEQHFKKNNWFGRDGKFETLQANDKIKDEYCKTNNYPMLRIKYDTPFDSIEDIIKDFIH